MTDTADPQATSSVVELCQLYVQQQQQSSSTIVVGTTLANLQSRLSKHVNQQHQQQQQPHEEVNACGTLDSLLLRHSSNSTPPAAVSLLQALSKSLVHGSSIEEQMNAARCLTNLAACNSSNNNSEDNYYGHPAETWCTYMVQPLVGVLPAWIHVVTSFIQIAQQTIQQHPSNNATVLSQSIIDLTEQCCWALGNIAGDSSSARQVILQQQSQPQSNDNIPSLIISALFLSHEVACLKQQATWIQNNTLEDLTVVGLCRNAAWALSNLARGAETSACLFLQNKIHDGRLTPRILANLLTSPERFFRSPSTNVSKSSSFDEEQMKTKKDNVDQQMTNTVATGTTTKIDETPPSWTDVALETMWFSAFLTAREYEAVDYLCSNGDTSSLLCEALAFRLGYVAHVLSLFSSFSAAGVKTIESMEVALRMAVPSIRAVGNIATACDGRYVSKLIQSKAKVSTTDAERKNQHVSILQSSYGPITASLARIIQDGSNPPSVKRPLKGNLIAVAAEAAWAAGTLLCDAGKDSQHPSTIAFKTLVSPLCHAITSGYAKLELKREAVLALYNAVAAPPTIHNDDGMAVADSSSYESLAIRDEFLRNIISTDDMIPALTDLLVCYDAEAVGVSVQLVNLVFRRLIMEHDNNNMNLKQRFEEANILSALETICDRASASSPSLGQDQWHSNNSVTSERSAEIAANLIDDFFDDDVMGEDDTSDDMMCNVQTQSYSSAGGEQTRYAFGLGNHSIGSNKNSSMNFDFSTTAGASVVTNESYDTPSVGRGRGRGHAMPAWMQQRTV
eukprot:CAMPEP_0197841852 /NCGR_PEP_ID=MMETSP1437-20131217/46410_1 /TAXON_ID=49252 ORGANISM="Eucampia antarctica, Strain CCMP1452" /NCGR_SAMPLE_ID=MMETSP1437 /ASSEMBLY_ACC=CAM_ASM_001096 /LENGTH=791 /DNA_ID=CAMNT_0043451659 /DNA_START=564 /DNA_END=2939 /DNA_ORIENTATION=+